MTGIFLRRRSGLSLTKVGNEYKYFDTTVGSAVSLTLTNFIEIFTCTFSIKHYVVSLISLCLVFFLYYYFHIKEFRTMHATSVANFIAWVILDALFWIFPRRTGFFCYKIRKANVIIFISNIFIWFGYRTFTDCCKLLCQYFWKWIKSSSP